MFFLDKVSVNYILALSCLFTVIILFLCFFIYPYSCQWQANRVFRIGKFQLAASFFTKALKVSVRDDKLWFCYGVALSRLSQWDEAMNAFEQVERLEPGQYSVFLERIAVLRAKKCLDVALRELNLRLTFEKNSNKLRLLRCAVEIEMQLYKEAEQDCDYLIEHGQESFLAEAYNNRGLVRLILGQESKAEADFDMSYLLDPRSSTARAYCAGVWIRRNMPHKAMLLCDTTIKIDPKCAVAYYYRGLAKSMLGDFKGAEVDRKKMIELNKGFTLFK